MSVLYSKACPRSHRSRALALWLPQCRGDLPSNIPHTTPSSRFKNRTVQYSTFIRLYWYISREFRTRFARLMPCTIPSDSPAINFVSKRPWQTFLQTAIRPSCLHGDSSAIVHVSEWTEWPDSSDLSECPDFQARSDQIQARI